MHSSRSSGRTAPGRRPAAACSATRPCPQTSAASPPCRGWLSQLSASAGTPSRTSRPSSCWGRSIRRGTGRCCRWVGSSPMPLTTAATSAAFSKNWRRPPPNCFRIERERDRPWGSRFPRAVFCLGQFFQKNYHFFYKYVNIYPKFNISLHEKKYTLTFRA